jgi:hypothetical protein
VPLWARQGTPASRRGSSKRRTCGGSSTTPQRYARSYSATALHSHLQRPHPQNQLMEKSRRRKLSMHKGVGAFLHTGGMCFQVKTNSLTHPTCIGRAESQEQTCAWRESETSHKSRLQSVLYIPTLHNFHLLDASAQLQLTAHQPRLSLLNWCHPPCHPPIRACTHTPRSSSRAKVTQEPCRTMPAPHKLPHITQVTNCCHTGTFLHPVFLQPGSHSRSILGPVSQTSRPTAQ